MTTRSDIMRAVRSTNTTPELRVRKLVHSMGCRYRLHRRDLPGTPDLVFPSRRTVLFVHGCFWHGHTCKRGARVPKSNIDYWLSKVARNKARDQANIEKLTNNGWKVITVWECEIADLSQLKERLSAEFKPSKL